VLLWTENEIAPILVHDGSCRDFEEARIKVRTVIEQMQLITGELFRAYENEFGVFSPIEGCFELYGLDFLVDDQWKVYLLEVNPGPDFKQTGSNLDFVILDLMACTIDVALLPLVTGVRRDPNKVVLVYEQSRRQKQMGR